MSKQIKIQATARKAHGSGEARRVRRTGQIPAALTLLSRGTETLQVNEHDFMMAMRGQEGEQVVVVLEVEGRPFNALLREVQRDVISSRPIHVDFGELDMTRKMRAAVRIKLVGEPEGVRTEGGVLTQMLHEIVIECLPGDFVESVAVDVSTLKLGGSIMVGDLRLGEAVNLVTHGGIAVAAVVAPATEEVAATDEAAAKTEAGAAEADAKAGAPAAGAAAGAAAAPAKK